MKHTVKLEMTYNLRDAVNKWRDENRSLSTGDRMPFTQACRILIRSGIREKASLPAQTAAGYPSAIKVRGKEEYYPAIKNGVDALPISTETLPTRYRAVGRAAELIVEGRRPCQVPANQVKNKEHQIARDLSRGKKLRGEGHWVAAKPGKHGLVVLSNEKFDTRGMAKKRARELIYEKLISQKDAEDKGKGA